MFAITAETARATADVQPYLDALAETNRQGFGFLVAFGVTWLVAALIWTAIGDRAGAYAALLQGMVGLPAGLALTAWGVVGERPENDTMNELSIYLSVGQLFVLPLVIALLARGYYVVAVASLSAVTAVHFVPYTWLYGTPIYVAIAAVIAVGIAVIVGRGLEIGRHAGLGVCALTGTALLLGGVAAFITAPA